MTKVVARGFEWAMAAVGFIVGFTILSGVSTDLRQAMGVFVFAALVVLIRAAGMWSEKRLGRLVGVTVRADGFDAQLERGQRMHWIPALVGCAVPPAIGLGLAGFAMLELIEVVGLLTAFVMGFAMVAAAVGLIYQRQRTAISLTGRVLEIGSERVVLGNRYPILRELEPGVGRLTIHTNAGTHDVVGDHDALSDLRRLLEHVGFGTGTKANVPAQLHRLTEER